MENAIGEIEALLSLAIARSAGPAARTRLYCAEVDLRWAIQGMANEGPVEKVGRHGDGASREVLKGRGAEKVPSRRRRGGGDNANCRIWVEAPKK
jgi:hypothetical protein